MRNVMSFKNLVLAIVGFYSLHIPSTIASEISTTEKIVLEKYADMIRYETAIVDETSRLLTDFDSSTLSGCIITIDGIEMCQVVFPHKTDAGQSFFVGFERDFTSKYYMAAWRGIGGPSSSEHSSFLGYDGKMLER